MEARTMEFDPHLYFQVGRETISEGMKRLQNLANWYNSTPEKAGLFDEIITYLQSLQPQIKEIESLAQREEARVSTDLHHAQEITQIREQNKEIEMVMNTNVENSSCSKRKRRSKVWEDFTYSVGKDGKEWAQCNHCKGKFVGSSKSGTTHLKNHLNSCPVLRNPGGDANKAKEKTVIDPEINGSDLVRKIIKYGLEGIKDEIVDVYQQEKDKLRGYLDKLPCPFNMTIQVARYGSLVMKIWFIDDSWELKNWTICFGHYNDSLLEIVKSSLVDWHIDKKISAIAVRAFDEKKEENICNWLNEQGLLSFTPICPSISSLFQRIHRYIRFAAFGSHWEKAAISTKLNKVLDCQKALNDLGDDVGNFLIYLRHKTANEYFPMICPIFSKLDQLERSDYSYICETVSHFRKNIDKLWNGSMLVLVTRVILDPRFKKDFIVKKLCEEMYDNDVGARLIGIIDDVTNIFNEYVKETNNPMSSFSQESELNRYYSDSKCPLDEGLDILQWWRDKSSTYPTVARMARDFLSIPIFVNHEDKDKDEDDDEAFL
ncbi:uncharacterized protein LOC116135375 isoform X2 [Pistacia vera]|uniref:uncharacterized protein LOC116135375 isoform X2 n=1 Tax=Pistacia vera TaxID=55513 RepID=UPI001263270D|nr:uncharacterized protein LOC116135375 isoform X2 [Pistacia vera]